MNITINRSLTEHDAEFLIDLVETAVQNLVYTLGDGDQIRYWRNTKEKNSRFRRELFCCWTGGDPNDLEDPD